MAILKQSTAYTRMFLIVQTADHLSGLTGASPTVTLSKAGGAFGAAGGTITEVSSGWYKIALNTTDTNTVGDLAYHVTATSGDATDFVDQVSATILSDVNTTTPPTTAAIATAVWQDTTSGDFTVSSSIGKSLYTSGNAPGAASGIALVGSNMGTITGALTAAQIATGVWQDTTAGDFTTALSVGKSIMNGVSLGTGLTVNAVTGLTASNLDAAISSRMATYTQPTGFLAATFPGGTVASTTNITSITGNITGNLSGSVGSVTGAVGSVTGAVGSVTARVTANSDQINGNATAASNVAHSMQAITRGTCSGGTTTTAVVSTLTSPGSLGASGQLIGRTILFDADTTTTNLQGQASNITASTTGATPTITFTAMTTAPANGDTFSVL